jgi:hypothetical protein
MTSPVVQGKPKVSGALQRLLRHHQACDEGTPRARAPVDLALPRCHAAVIVVLRWDLTLAHASRASAGRKSD